MRGSNRLALGLAAVAVLSPLSCSGYKTELAQASDQYLVSWRAYNTECRGPVPVPYPGTRCNQFQAQLNSTRLAIQAAEKIANVGAKPVAQLPVMREELTALKKFTR